MTTSARYWDDHLVFLVTWSPSNTETYKLRTTVPSPFKSTHPLPGLLPQRRIFQIFFFLYPINVISIRQTCKAFADISSRREVWTTAVHTMCYHNAVYLPTFSVDNMSVSELENVATAPGRVLRRLEGHQSSSDEMPLKPEVTRYFSPEEGEVNFDTVFLVPGGRFLVTGSSDGLKLWDLSSLSDAIPSKIVMSWLFPLSLVFSVRPTADHQGLILAAERGTSDEDSREIVIFEYYPSSAVAPKEKVWELTDDEEFSMYTLSASYFIRVQEHTLHVWNFHEDTAASWTMPEDKYEGIMLDGDTIILIGRRSLAGWKIPQLEKRSARSQGLDTILPPLFIVPVDNISNLLKKQIRQAGLIWKQFSDWYDLSDKTKVYDITSMFKNDPQYTLETYQIEARALGTPNNLEGYKVSLTSTTQIPRSKDEADSEMVIDDHRLCNGRVVRCWSNRGFLQVHVTGPGLSPYYYNKDIDADIGVAPESSQMTCGLNEFSFDPVSGRLCHLIDDGSTIAVLDFIPFQ